MAKRRMYRKKRTRRSSRKFGRVLRMGRPRNVNLQSKLVVFRDRYRVVLSGDPKLLEGVAITQGGNFNQISGIEYARGREEVVQFMRTSFAGFSISIKKTSEVETQWSESSANTANSVNKINSKGRLSFVTDLYVTAGQLSTNNVAIDTCVGAKRNISSKGSKVFTYKLPRHFVSGRSKDAGSAFPSSIFPMDWKSLTNFQDNHQTADVSCPNGFFLVADGWPVSAVTSANVTNVYAWHSTSCEVRVNYYFKCWGKRVNI